MTTFKIARINESGMQQIADALGTHHKLGRDHFTPSMLAAWASNAEDSYNNGTGCEFEIRGMDTKSGAPVIVVISPDGYDTEVLVDD